MSRLVMKFGGASVAGLDDFKRCAELIAIKRQEFSQIVVVISAMKGSTDYLIDLAKAVNPEPPPREYDMLLSVGERISMSLLAMALERMRIEAISFTGSQSGIITSDDHSQAAIIDVNPWRILPELEKNKVVIVAGFQGVSKEREITTLGRGGSDTTAVALAVAINAQRVEFLKDVAGIFDQDPKMAQMPAKYPYLSYEQALEIIRGGACVLHERCLLLAAANAMPLHVRSFLEHRSSGTWIGPRSERRFAPQPNYEKGAKEPEKALF